MNVDCIEPFYRLLRTVGTLNTHSMVDNIPDDRGNCQTCKKGEEETLNERLATSENRRKSVHGVGHTSRAYGNGIGY